MRKIHKSMRGVVVNMEELQERHKDTVAITGVGSSVKMNSNGDVLGANGAIIKRREQIDTEYNKNISGSTKSTGVKGKMVDEFMTPEEALQSFLQDKGTPTIDSPSNLAERPRGAKRTTKKDDE